MNSTGVAIAAGQNQQNQRRRSVKTLIATLVAFAIVTPALAADEFYIVRDTTTKKCTVVDKKPTVTTTTIVGDGTVYKSRTEADTAVKTVKVCTEK
jgi:hypothetical protein